MPSGSLSKDVLSSLSTFFNAFVGAYIILYVLPKLKPNLSLRHIPTVGCPSDSWISSWVGAFRYIKHANDMLNEGYKKFPGRAFKVPTIGFWQVVVSSERMIEDMKAVPADVLSFVAGTEDLIQTRYTLGRDLYLNRYHVNVVRTPLTRNLASCYEEIRDELVTAFPEEILVPNEGWVQIPVFDGVMRIVSRTSNRMYVGLPLCRNPDFIKLSTEFATAVIKTAFMINLFPKILRPLAGRIVGPLPAALRSARELLGETIDHRLEQHKKFGKDWEGKPNDLISWLIDYASEDVLNKSNIIHRILLVLFASIHTTSSAFTNVLYDLAARPEYIAPLREEIERVLQEEGGWSKAAVNKMRKLDSFVKESERMTVGALIMNRKALKDFTFSDGTLIPVGNNVGVAALATHEDGQYYDNPEVFDGFRFANLREQGDGEGIKHQSITPSLSYLVFGNGRHACPGRFFAMLEVKNLLAHTVMNYDVKFEDNKRPKNEWMFQMSMPRRNVAVSMRKRRN